MERRPANHRAVEDYLRKAVARIDALAEENKNVTTHGLRTTFTNWAADNGYNSDLINLTLGHNIKAISENKTNWSYFYQVTLIKDRTTMMDWEHYCLSLCGAPRQAADNVISFPPASTA